MFYPVNILRDLYVPFICDGDRWLLLLKEDDPELKQKEKELFWIHYTAITKANFRSRVLFWMLFYSSVLLLGFNVLCNVKAALVG